MLQYIILQTSPLLQLNWEQPNKHTVDYMTENMLKTFSTLIKKSFFQDLPYLWHQNPEHTTFSLPFFARFKTSWTAWCNIHLAYVEFMERAHTEHVKVSA